MQASETTILPSSRPIDVRIARPNTSSSGPGENTEWKVPTVIADEGAANGAIITKPGLYGACVWMTSKRRSRNSFFILLIIRKSTVCSVCDALPYMRSAWPIRSTSNGSSRAAGADAPSVTARGWNRLPVMTVTSCPRALRFVACPCTCSVIPPSCG